MKNNQENAAISLINTVAVFQMSSGTTVIGQVIEELGDDLVLLYPLEMNFSFDEDDGSTRLYLNRWMPYNANDLVLVNSKTVESRTTCNDKYKKMYNTKVLEFKKDAEKNPLKIGTDDEESPVKEPEQAPRIIPIKRVLH